MTPQMKPAPRNSTRSWSRSAETFHRLRALVTDECVLWPGPFFRTGYGQVNYRGRVHRTHRLALILASRIDEAELHAAHGPCHDRKCMNVRHLYWATREENMADRLRDGTDQFGERNPNVKLTDDKVRAILRAKGTQVEVATAFGVDQATVSLLRRGKTWNHLWLEFQEAQS